MCCCTKKLVADAITYLADVFRSESRLWRLEAFPPPSRPLGFGETKHVGERKVNDMILERFRKTFLPLPPAADQDADIAKGHIQLLVDDAVSAEADVAYDLTTREPLAPFEFEVEKGKAYSLSLVYVDDDGNVGGALVESGVASDTTPPTTPVAFGATEHLGERETADV
jgi:hypothetical protein